MISTSEGAVSAQVAVDLAQRQRRAVHHEAQRQVQAHARAPRSRAGAPTCADAASGRRPSRPRARSWPMKVTRPSGVTPRVAGFAMSWSSATSISPARRSSSSARGSASTCAHALGASRGTPARGRRRARRRARRPRACARGRPCGGTRSDRARGTPRAAAPALRARRAGPAGRRPRRDAPARRCGRARRRGARRRCPRCAAASMRARTMVSAIDGEAHLHGEAGQPQQAHRIVGERVRAHQRAGGAPRGRRARRAGR